MFDWIETWEMWGQISSWVLCHVSQVILHCFFLLCSDVLFRWCSALMASQCGSVLNLCEYLNGWHDRSCQRCDDEPEFKKNFRAQNCTVSRLLGVFLLTIRCFYTVVSWCTAVFNLRPMFLYLRFPFLVYLTNPTLFVLIWLSPIKGHFSNSLYSTLNMNSKINNSRIVVSFIYC